MNKEKLMGSLPGDTWFRLSLFFYDKYLDTMWPPDPERKKIKEDPALWSYIETELFFIWLIEERIDLDPDGDDLVVRDLVNMIIKLENDLKVTSDLLQEKTIALDDAVFLTSRLLAKKMPH